MRWYLGTGISRVGACFGSGVSLGPRGQDPSKGSGLGRHAGRQRGGTVPSQPEVREPEDPAGRGVREQQQEPGVAPDYGGGRASLTQQGPH